MKSQDLKKVLKPLIKECVKEMMIEDGFLSSVVSEVLKGMNASVIVENKATTPEKPTPSREKDWERGLADKMEAERQERIKKLNESMTSQHNTDIFEGVSTIPDDTSASGTGGSSPLSGVPPDDPGVDISGILNVAGGSNKWKTLAGGSNV